MKTKRMKYRLYRVITKEQAFAAGFDNRYLNCNPMHVSVGQNHYDYKMARKLLQEGNYREIHYCLPSHNDARTRYNAAPGVIVYVKGYHGPARRYYGEALKDAE